MTESYLLSLTQSSLTVALTLAAPILIISLVVGVLISLVQAATQIHEASLSFVPKLIGVCAVMLLLGSWMLQQILTFTSNLFTSLPSLVR
jgi:flagellar biosynthetic protein FliQ